MMLVIAQSAANTLASCTETLAVGIGRYMVRVMMASRSFSMIWLMQTEAPDNKNPPRVNINMIGQFTLPLVAKA